MVTALWCDPALSSQHALRRLTLLWRISVAAGPMPCQLELDLLAHPARTAVDVTLPKRWMRL